MFTNARLGSMIRVLGFLLCKCMCTSLLVLHWNCGLCVHQDVNLDQQQYLEYQQRLYTSDRMHTVAVWVRHNSVIAVIH